MFAGGGTGGHLYPAIAMYEGLQRKSGGIEVLFVGARHGLECKLIPRLGLPLVLLPGAGMRGKSVWGKARAVFEVIRGVIRAVRTTRAFKPHVVVGTGGYASVSAVVAAVVTRTRRILQEQNSVPGLVNRRLARFADLVLLSYAGSEKMMPPGARTAVIGNPLRAVVRKDPSAGSRHFGLDPNRLTVLVIGGSRGAHSLNVAASDAALVLLEKSDAQFVLLTGEADFESVSRKFAGQGDRVVVRDYLDEVQHAYGAADVAVARAGASSVFELAACGIPSIFVPYPYAADDHQRLNADPLRDVGGAVVVPDSELDGRRLIEELEPLLADEARRRQMSEAMLRWVKTDAADVAADCIRDVAAGRTPVIRQSRM